MGDDGGDYEAYTLFFTHFTLFFAVYSIYLKPCVYNTIHFQSIYTGVLA